jgi:hypothetical protein
VVDGASTGLVDLRILVVARPFQDRIAVNGFALLVLMDPQIIQVRRRENLSGFDAETVSAPQSQRLAAPRNP